MNESYELTAEGKKLFDAFMFSEYKTRFKEVVDKLVAEQKDK